jgi:beta-lactamase class C
MLAHTPTRSETRPLWDGLNDATCIVALITALTAGLASAGAPETDGSVVEIIAQELARWPMEPGGAAVAVQIAGRTLFVNEGMADQATKRPITSDSLFNLASLGKAFDATLLALAVCLGKKPVDVPNAPANVYADAGWADWRDWLGK